MSQTRRLAAILAADVAGYSRLMGADEEGTLERLKALRRELLDPKIAEHKGRIVKTTGDGLLVEFASVVDAVRCAVAVQQAMPDRNTGIVAADSRIELRIGINLGDVIVEGDDLYGDGVNIAARIEALADAGGVFVSNTVHDHVRDRLPFVFEDLGEQQVKNITRPVRVYRVRDLAKSASAPSQPALPLPDKPSIAVLPFANMSGDPEQEYFVDGMVEEIITALSRIRWLFVIARNSTFTYKGRAVDVKQVGRELGVRYVLEGSVRKAGQRVRITGQLIDAVTGAHLWADRFDGSLEDVFDLQDRVASSVAGVIEPALRAAEIRRSAARPTTDLGAYSFPARASEPLSNRERADYPGPRIARSGDRDRSALRTRTVYGGDLPHAPRQRRLGRRAGSIPPQGQRSRSAGAPDGRQRSAHSRELRQRVGVFRRGYRCNDRAGRPCARAQPELRPRLVTERPSQELGRPTRPRDRPCRDLAAPKPTRAYGSTASRDGHGPFLSVSLRKRYQSCSCRFRTIQAFPAHTALSPRVMPTWAGSAKRARSSKSCAPLPLWSCRVICRGATPRTASSTYRACAWRWATGHDPNPPPCRSL
jgi:TolB-like protein/class 3 adenylate cyclase